MKIGYIRVITVEQNNNHPDHVCYTVAQKKVGTSRWNQLEKIVYTAVLAAQQLAGTETGKEMSRSNPRRFIRRGSFFVIFSFICIAKYGKYCIIMLPDGQAHADIRL